MIYINGKINKKIEEVLSKIDTLSDQERANFITWALEQYDPLICHIAEHYGKFMEKEDALQSVKLGFVEAINTYDGATPMPVYFHNKMTRELKHQQICAAKEKVTFCEIMAKREELKQKGLSHTNADVQNELNLCDEAYSFACSQGGADEEFYPHQSKNYTHIFNAVANEYVNEFSLDAEIAMPIIEEWYDKQPTARKKFFKLAFIEQVPESELAKMYGCSVSNTNKMIRRMRLRLQQLLHEAAVKSEKQ